MNVNLEQLKELLEMQRVLDENILKEHGSEYDEEIAEQMKIALFVELGELMNELPSYFKHWKINKVDNRDKALVEFVDCLHFQLSLVNHYKVYIDKLEEKIEWHKELSINSLLMNSSLFVRILDGLGGLLALGNKLGFKWDEIYKVYKDKNAINYERLREGY